MKNTDLEKLMSVLSSTPDVPLKFYLGDISINPGYHVTEVKFARIESMDCGKHKDSWEELTIQLLDGTAKSKQDFMSTSKFRNIVSAALKSLPEKMTPSLFFEFSPNNGPLQKLKIQTVEYEDGNISVHLNHTKAICKSFQGLGMAATAIDKISSKLSKPTCCSNRTACCG